ncbi:MAG: hypothetical protein RLN88_07320 [Ekhidna sp.]|uniref:hypothetical protein n=1 Tax=Ekhidna sp. TaxID=2608089 RepID=UPI0032EF9F63
MKRIFTTALLLSLAFSFTHCGSDDGDDGGNGDSNIDADALALLTGSWSADFATASGCSNASDNGVKDCGELLTCLAIQVTESGLIGIIDFTSENGGIFTFRIKSLTSSQVVYCDQTDDTECYTVNYSVSGNTLNATYTNDDFPGCTLQASFTKDEE